MTPEIENKEVGYLYDHLNIIDNKASALLTFNAVFLASISIWTGYVGPNYLHLILDLVFIALLISCGQLLRVVWLTWARDTRVTLDNGPTRLSPERALDELKSVRATRTANYQLAWWISAMCIFAVLSVTAVHTTGTLLKATGTCNPRCASFFSPETFGNLDSRP